MRALLLLSLVAAPVLAADPALGEAVYRDRCAVCHTANRAAQKRVKGAPDLVHRMKERTGEQLNLWVLRPESRKEDAGCDTTALVREPELLPAVWAYLQGQLEAPPLPPQERRREALNRASWRAPNQKKESR